MTNCVHLRLESVLLIITSGYDFLFLGKMRVIIFIFNKPSTSKVVSLKNLVIYSQPQFPHIKNDQTPTFVIQNTN